ncbi:hypothetical protein K440DRAFT_677996 [Wilcoxina mikolae CBS 423.85]|nr:hypothetical protein K440DRAFT_677996 [Wilcoxina mikolae CBS 423.85]
MTRILVICHGNQLRKERKMAQIRILHAVRRILSTRGFPGVEPWEKCRNHAEFAFLRSGLTSARTQADRFWNLGFEVMLHSSHLWEELEDVYSKMVENPPGELRDVRVLETRTGEDYAWYAMRVILMYWFDKRLERQKRGNGARLSPPASPVNPPPESHQPETPSRWHLRPRVRLVIRDTGT